MRRRQTVAHSAATLRASLVGKTVTSFSCNCADGPAVSVGSAIEDVKVAGKHLEILFDDGLVLHTVPNRRGRWELFHEARTPRRIGSPDIVITTAHWTAVAYNMKTTETFRLPDPLRHPRAGRRGPDLRQRIADLHEAASRLFHYSDPEVVAADAMMDPRVMVGIGNVLRCEVLWACGVHPWARIGDLAESTCLDVVMTAAGLVRTINDDPTSPGVSPMNGGLSVYGRNGQLCTRCAGIIRLTKHGESERLLFWCPGCQVAFEPLPVIDDSDPIARATDPHPAATQYLREIFQRRTAS